MTTVVLVEDEKVVGEINGFFIDWYHLIERMKNEEYVEIHFGSGNDHHE